MRIMKKYKRSLAIGLVMSNILMATAVYAADYETHWAKEAIEKWSTYEVVKGMENGDFKPNDSITRAELATFINRIFKFTKGSMVRVYEDVKPEAWYTEAVENITSRGLMYCPGQKFEPSKPATRQEVAYALAKAYHIESDVAQELTLVDEEAVAPWALESVKALVQQGYITGYPDGTFKPEAPITRAEVVTLMNNLTSQYITVPGTYTETIKGNVVITSSDVVLQDTVVEGNVYLAAGIGDGKVSLDNVEVKGTVYIQGGHATLSGVYNTVQLESGKPLTFKKGTMKQLIVAANGSKIQLYKGTVTDYLLVAAEGEFNIEGIVKDSSNAPKATAYVEEAGVFISGEFVPVEVAGTEITINLRQLASKYKIYDQMESLIIYTNVDGAYIKGPMNGKLDTNVAYSFKQADVRLGIFEELLDKVTDQSSELKGLVQSMGVDANTVYALLSEDGQISINHMIRQYENIAALAQSYAGTTLPGEYTFKRELCYGEETPVPLTIRLVIQ